MTDQEKSLLSICSFFDDNNIEYMIIGGIANAIWGNPRSTLDIDVSIWAETEGTAVTALRLANAFRCRVADPVEFVARTRVLPLMSSFGTPLDIVFALLPFERDAISRAVPVRVGDRDVRFCTAEDLVIMKVFSSRPRDLEDARAILNRNGPRLDHEYLEPRIRELTDLLENPEILKRYLDWRKV